MGKRLPNRPPVVRLTAPATSKVGQSVVVDGSKSTDDQKIRSGVLTWGDGQTLAFSGLPYAWAHTYTLEGTYKVTLTLQDNHGVNGVGSLTVVVTPAIVEPPPPLVWTLTATPVTIESGQTSTLDFFAPTSDFHNVFINGVRPVYTSSEAASIGTLVVRPPSTTPFTLASTNAAGVPYSPLTVTVTVTPSTIPSTGKVGLPLLFPAS